MGRLNPSRETKFSGTHGDRGIFIFPIQLTTSRIGNLTRLIHNLLYVMTIHTYIHTYLEVYWPHAGGLSAVNAIGTQLRDPINSGLAR